MTTISEPTCSWREEGGVICFSVTSDGTTGEGWIARLKRKGLPVSRHAKKVLHSPDFKVTNGMTTEIVVLKGVLFDDGGYDRVTRSIRVEAERRKLEKPGAEMACLIRKKFANEEIEAMDLRCIVAMHEPIEIKGGSVDGSCLLYVDRGDCCGLYACDGRSDLIWPRAIGFAFAVPQVSS